MINRKNLMIILFAGLVFLLFSYGKACAAEVFLNGKKVDLDVKPVEKKGLVFVPLRGIFEKMGAKVSFNKSGGIVTASRKGRHIALKPGQPYAKVDGFKTYLLQPAFEKDGRVLVPLRFLSESMGCEVKWHPPTKIVAISSISGRDPFKGIDFNDEKEEDTWGKPVKKNIKGISGIEKIRKNPANSGSKKAGDDNDFNDEIED